MKSTRSILDSLARGEISVERAEKELHGRLLEKIGDMAVIDTGRQDRKGVPEVILAETKADEDLPSIATSMVAANGFALLTRVSRKQAALLTDAFKGKKTKTKVTGRGDHLTVLIHQDEWSFPKPIASIAVISAGTSDIPYACEVEAIAEVMGVRPIVFNDVGVAGMHRLVEPLKRIQEENVAAIVVLAGMEGALPTVVASLVSVPVIGLPVPTGYGFGGKGETALASMLQSCALGLAVVNIGNGVGAGAFAALIARTCASGREK